MELSTIKTKVCCDAEESELGGLAQLSQSSYSAVINMGNATSVKGENVDFGFVDVSQGPGHAVPLECAQPPDEDPLTLPVRPAPHIKQEILDIVKQEPPDPENNAMDVGQLLSATEVDPLALPVCPSSHIKREILDNAKQEPPDLERSSIDIGQLSRAKGVLPRNLGMLHSCASSTETGRPSIGITYNDKDIQTPQNIAVIDIKSNTSEFVTITRQFHRNFPEGHSLPFSVQEGVSYAIEATHTSEQTGQQDVHLNRSGRKQNHVRSIASPSQHTDQVDIHSREKLWNCDKCNKRFFLYSNLTTHKKIHSGAKPYVCDVCNKWFVLYSNLTMHKKIHSGVEPYACDMCGKRFIQRCGLISHEKFCSTENTLVCDVSYESFTMPSDLTMHKKIHSRVKTLVCNLCGTRFTYSGSLSRHKKFCGAEKTLVRDVSHESFTMPSDLTRHNKVHSGVKPFVRGVCDRRFTDSPKFKKHKNIHSAENPLVCDVTHEQGSDVLSRVSGVKLDHPYSCINSSSAISVMLDPL